MSAAVLLIALAVGAADLAGAFGPAPLTPAEIAAEQAAARARAAAAARRHDLSIQAAQVASAASLVGVSLPTSAAAPAPTPATLFATPLPAHVVYGFVPYWEVPTLTAADYADTTELAYYGVNVGATGGLDHTGYGWADLQLSSFTTFVSDAHSAGDRVLFTVSTESPKVIAHLTQYPGASSARLAAQVSVIVSADHLDGVDLDIEGRATRERPGFVAFVADLAARLKAVDPNGELTVDTYPESAGSSTDFFDVKRLAPLVDTIFVMAYDMVTPTNASPNSPLASSSLGLTDLSALAAYAKAVPVDKVVLGLPLYGYDFTTVGRAPGAAAVTPDPIAVTYASIIAAGHPARWDPGSETPYYVFKLGGEWHQTWFDDPLSLALKTAEASYLGFEGVGAWALGQEGTNSAMIAALDGGSAPKKLGLAATS